MTKTGEVLLLDKMPEEEEKVWELICPGVGANPVRGCIEIVHSRPGAGHVGMFSFGRNYGFLRGCLVASGMNWEDVRPVMWQRELGIPRIKNEEYPDRKRRLTKLARDLFPEIPKEVGKVTQTTADALLIAEFLRQKYEF